MPRTKRRAPKRKSPADEVPEGFVRLPLTGALVPIKKSVIKNAVRPLSWREQQKPSPGKSSPVPATFSPRGSSKRVFTSPEEAARWLRKFHRETPHLQYAKSFKKKRKSKGPRIVFYQGGAPGLVQQR